MTARTPFGAKPFEREWKFLCACASPLPSSGGNILALAANLDWDLALELAEEHSVIGVVAERLKESGDAGMPVDAREKLQAMMRTQQLFSLSMAAELFRILDAYGKAGIETILVKGPVVSYLAYGNPAVRSYVDLDLLVRDAAILPACRILTALGFEADVPEAAILAGKIPGEYLFKRAGAQQIVELHTEKTFRYYPRPMRIEDLFARRRRVILEGREVPAPCVSFLTSIVAARRGADKSRTRRGPTFPEAFRRLSGKTACRTGTCAVLAAAAFVGRLSVTPT